MGFFTSIFGTDEKVKRLTDMFATFNTTMQSSLKMNQEQLVTIQQLSSDIGEMADRIGDMADRIVLTQQIQSANFVATQENTLAFFGITQTPVSSESLNLIPDVTSIATNTTDEIFKLSIGSFQTMTKMITPFSAPTLAWTSKLSGENTLGAMVLSMSKTMQSMMELSNEYVNTVIKLTHDVGEMAGRIGEMSDRIIETKELQDENFIATEQNALLLAGVNGTATSTDSGAAQSVSVGAAEVVNESVTDRDSGFTTILSASDSIGRLADGIGATADLMVARNINPEAFVATAINSTSGVLDFDNSSILQMAIEFNALMAKMTMSVMTSGGALNAMVEMFESANDIVRYMIGINERFVNTALALSDDIGTMADRIGEMSDRIVETQGVLSPLYLGEGVPSVSNDTVEVQQVSISTPPVDMSMLTDMTNSLNGALFEFATQRPADNDAFFDAFESMFATANETMQMMSSVNTTFLNATLELSYDIGLMADRIGEMSDRIVETQILQSENFLATQDAALSLSDIFDTQSDEMDALLPPSEMAYEDSFYASSYEITSQIIPVEPINEHLI